MRLAWFVAVPFIASPVSIFVQCSNDTVAIALHLLPSNFGRHNQGRSLCEKSPTRSRGLPRLEHNARLKLSSTARQTISFL